MPDTLSSVPLEAAFADGAFPPIVAVKLGEPDRPVLDLQRLVRGTMSRLGSLQLGHRCLEGNPGLSVAQRSRLRERDNAGQREVEAEVEGDARLALRGLVRLGERAQHPDLMGAVARSDKAAERRALAVATEELAVWLLHCRARVAPSSVVLS